RRRDDRHAGRGARGDEAPPCGRDRVPAPRPQDLALQRVRATSPALRVPHPRARRHASRTSALHLPDHDAANPNARVPRTLSEGRRRRRGPREGEEGLGRGTTQRVVDTTPRNVEQRTGKEPSERRAKNPLPSPSPSRVARTAASFSGGAGDALLV